MCSSLTVITLQAYPGLDTSSEHTSCRNINPDIDHLQENVKHFSAGNHDLHMRNHVQ